MATYDLIADLPLTIESYGLEGRELDTGNPEPRMTTLITLSGGSQEGVGEDVVYDGLDHMSLQATGPVQPLAGDWTIDSLSKHLDGLDLFPDPPVRDFSRLYRRWAFESAALDLALRQAGVSLADAVGREPRPVTFVVSMRLGEPPSLERIHRLLGEHADLRFKLDPTEGWDDAFVAQLRDACIVDSLDLKGMYKGTPVDVPTDPELYERVATTFPDAWLEDPDLTPETEPVLEPHRDRITWDAPIHSVEDVAALAFGGEALRPRMVNLKPSRIGSLEALFAAYDYCAEHGIGAYGGGQTELGPGRGQIQYLSSLFHPDTPNDVAPSGYNLPEPPRGLPDSPLAPAPSATGFRWGE